MVVFGSTHTQAQTSIDPSSSSGRRGGSMTSTIPLLTGNGGLRWGELFRTEIQTISEKPSYTESYLSDVNIHFNALECLVAESCKDIKIVIYRLVNDTTSKETKKEDLSMQMEVARTVLPRKIFDSKNVLKIKMKVKMKMPVDIAVPLIKDGEVIIGIVKLSSQTLQDHRLWLRKNIAMTPYSEILYSFGTGSGMTLSLEQLYASPYAITTAQALLGLWGQERHYHSDMMIQRLRENIPSHNNLMNTENEAGQLDTLRQVLDNLEEIVQESFLLNNIILQNCQECFVGEETTNNVLSKDYGGHMLRRSVWKKITTWQYCTTNLNTHLLIDKYFTFREILQQADNTANSWNSSYDDTKPPLHYTPTITLGCPTAHELKFTEGGLRKIFYDILSPEHKLLWLFAIQSPTFDLFNQLIVAHPKEAVSLFGVKASSYSPTAFFSTPDEFAHILKRKYELSRRIDICGSQALGCALASIRTTLMLATLVGGVYFDVLARSLKLGFIVMFESLLSTQGAEIGMIEDLEIAALWLNLVTIRFVTTLPAISSPSTSSKRNSSQSAVVKNLEPVLQTIPLDDEVDFSSFTLDNHSGSPAPTMSGRNNARLGPDGKPINGGESGNVTARRDEVRIRSVYIYTTMCIYCFYL